MLSPSWELEWTVPPLVHIELREGKESCLVVSPGSKLWRQAKFQVGNVLRRSSQPPLFIRLEKPVSQSGKPPVLLHSECEQHWALASGLPPRALNLF